MRARTHFNARNVTDSGGLFLPLLFAERLGLRDPFKHLLNEPGWLYEVADLLMPSLACVLARAPRLHHMNTPRYDRGLSATLGLEQLPEEGNVHKKLAQATPQELDAMEEVNSRLFEKTNRTEDKITIGVDLHTTTVTVYGKEEGSAVGYNPKKPGRRSYQIAVAFVANNGDLIAAQLRPGNTVASSDLEGFGQKGSDRLPPDAEVAVVRMDKGRSVRPSSGPLSTMKHCAARLSSAPKSGLSIAPHSSATSVPYPGAEMAMKNGR